MNGNSDSASAELTSQDCERKAHFLCSLDVFQVATAEKPPKLHCLQPRTMSTTTFNDVGQRRKRGANRRKEPEETQKENEDEKTGRKLFGKYFVHKIVMV